MKNFGDLKKYLLNNNINIESKIDDKTLILKISSIEKAIKNDIIFFNNYNFLEALKITKASFCIINKEYSKYLPSNCLPILVIDPYLTYAHTSNFFYNKISANTGLSKNIIICNKSIVSKKSLIDNFVTVNNSTIEDDVVIGSNCNIGPNTYISSGSIIKSGCSISNTTIGKNTTIHSSTVIGGSGFGFSKKIKFLLSI